MLGIDPPMLLARGIVSNAYSGVVHWVYNLDRQGWFVVLCCAVVIGVFALRGFGSRTDY